MATWSRCKLCHGLITWGVKPNGRPEPKNPDGTTHLSDCPALYTRGGKGKRRRTLVRPPSRC